MHVTTKQLNTFLKCSRHSFCVHSRSMTKKYMLSAHVYVQHVSLLSCASALQLGQVIWIIWVNQVTFYLSQPSLTRFIKYPGLTWIFLGITCVNNDVSRWRCLGWCEHITSIHFEKSHYLWRGSTKYSNKIAP